MSSSRQIVTAMIACSQVLLSLQFPKVTRRSKWKPSSSLGMVRNIDLCETLIFYGAYSILLQDESGNQLSHSVLPGVENLVDECYRDDTAVVAIMEDDDCVQALKLALSNKSNRIHYRTQESLAPDPRDLWEAIHSIHVQPKGFGGSSGFGTKSPDPERHPLPKHCVVLATTEEQCRAARAMGMRVLCLMDNALADAVVDCDWDSITMDDVATPGSFWLNPPHPRDDEGYAVDPLMLIERYERLSSETECDSKTDTAMELQKQLEQPVCDDYLAAILADMDPL